LTPKLWLGDATRDKSPSDPTGGKARTEFVPVNLRVNGQARTITVEPRTTRSTGCTAIEKACDHGECGACQDFRQKTPHEGVGYGPVLEGISADVARLKDNLRPRGTGF
jgi:hypothetical protein